MIRLVDHFSFTVADIGAALDFFCGALGLSAGPVMEVRDDDVRRIVGLPDADLRIALVDIPGGSRIELIQYVRPEGKPVDSRPCDPGAAHIAFEVSDVMRLYRELTGRGVTFIHPPVWAPGNDGTGTWGVCYLRGPDGITIELVEKKA
ncbi:MAG: hypothetical protein GXY47_01725 [Acidobacteria bacterium]|nr:hypothetical protein [Acidobacteriota bacterium]